MAWLPLGLTAQVVFCHVHGHDAQCAAETGREKRVSGGGFGGSPPPWCPCAGHSDLTPSCEGRPGRSRCSFKLCFKKNTI